MALADIFQSHKTVIPVFVSLGKSTTPTTAKKSRKKAEGSTKKLEAEETWTPRETRTIPKKKITSDTKDITLRHTTRRKTRRNLPTTCSKKQLMKLFCQYGKIESVRFRCARSGALLPKRIATKRGWSTTETTAAQDEVVAYVVFASEDSVTKSLEANGTLIDDRHLRVDAASGSTQHKHTHSIFVGNLPFTITSEQLREAFQQYGEIDGVRVVRDQKTGIGKGFGFVLFKEKSGVMFALKNAKNIEIDGRTLRIFKSSENPQKVIRKKNIILKKKKHNSGTKPRNDKKSSTKRFHKTMYKKGEKP
ncbi:RNA-binding protein 34-like [Dysidea avara]|uniref:RNA-binding protein 34-like n=1 Tax=Dysidea avara TaxID=196820 RepID=UPI0033272245